VSYTKTRFPAIAAGPRGTLHWRLSKLIICSWRWYRGGSPTTVQAWRTCPLWELSPSHRILVLTRGLVVFCVHVCLLYVSFVCVLYVPSVRWYCWLGLLTCKNCLPYNLYCVGGDVKHCSIRSSPIYLQLDNIDCTVSRHLPLKSTVTLKPSLGLTQGH